MRSTARMIAVLAVLSLSACTPKQDGSVEGKILPEGTPAHVTVLREGNAVTTVSVAGSDGSFRLVLPAGTYAVTATVPGSSVFRRADNVLVRPGEATVLPPFDLAEPAGTASLAGRIVPARPGSEVVLLYEGKERAAVQTDSEGRYEFTGLPPGSYEVQARAPGHTADASTVVITGDQKVEQNTVLFPIVKSEGVDWTTGRIRATGTGRPPAGAPTVSVRRAMAERAALADARRNLLRTVERIRLDSARTVRDAMRDGGVASRVRGFLRGYTVVSERDLEDGGVEVVLELPLTGPGGLSRYLAE